MLKIARVVHITCRPKGLPGSAGQSVSPYSCSHRPRVEAGDQRGLIGADRKYKFNNRHSPNGSVFTGLLVNFGVIPEYKDGFLELGWNEFTKST